jgi:hypothetical protein
MEALVLELLVLTLLLQTEGLEVAVVVEVQTAAMVPTVSSS